MSSNAPPRPDAPFLDRSMVIGILAGGLTLAAIVGAADLVGLSEYQGERARTLALVAWLVGHAVLGIGMAWERRPVSLRDLLANPALMGWAATAVIFAALITLVGPLREALHGGAVPVSAAAEAALAAVVGSDVAGSSETPPSFPESAEWPSREQLTEVPDRRLPTPYRPRPGLAGS